MSWQNGKKGSDTGQDAFHKQIDRRDRFEMREEGYMQQSLNMEINRTIPVVEIEIKHVLIYFKSPNSTIEVSFSWGKGTYVSLNLNVKILLYISSLNISHID